MITWHGDAPPAPQPPGAAGWVRVVLRGLAILAVLYGGVLVLLALRAVERLICGARRPVSRRVPRWAFGRVVRVLGLRLVVRGAPMAGQGAQVANHSSWLDIIVLNACQQITFVSKAEVSRWPGIGFLARAAGTVFIRRDPKEAKAQQALLDARFRAGDRLLFFPEGTSSDGRRVLPFKSTLFQSFYQLPGMQVQPVTLIWTAPEGADPRFYGWWGDMALGPHLLGVLAARRQGAVEVVFHPPLTVADFASRKDLCAAAEAAVRGGLPCQDARPR